MLVIKITVASVLAIIAWQDFKSRLVSVALFPLLAVLLTLEKRLDYGQTVNLPVMLMDLAFLVLQLLVLTIYFSLKNGRLIWIAKDLLGWGDLLLLATCSFYFSLLNYVLFYLVSLILTLVCWGSYRFFLKPNAFRIPLAGFQSIIFIFFLTFSWVHGGSSLTTDDWILRLMRWNQ